MPDPHADTASRRAATGLDPGARELILRGLGEASGGDIGPELVAAAFFRDRFGGLADYVEAVDLVWGHSTRFLLEREIGQASTDAQFSYEWPRRVTPGAAAARAMLLAMPEPDFRVAIEAILEAGRLDLDERITSICRNRGAPWALSEGRFAYVGDESIEREVLRPALAAINRPEFSGGVRSEFASARDELARGTPESLKQSVYESGCAVESAMKVVLERNGIVFDAERDTASKLFDLLVSSGLVPRHMQSFVLSTSTPRNRRGGHGAGARAHAVGVAEAEAMVAGAAGSIAYLADRLP
jgi:hypothetical protein